MVGVLLGDGPCLQSHTFGRVLAVERHRGKRQDFGAGPMQDQGAREVATTFDGRDTGNDFFGGADRPVDELAVGCACFGAAKPFFLIRSDVDGAVECTRPVQVGIVEVRVANLVAISLAECLVLRKCNTNHDSF